LLAALRNPNQFILDSIQRAIVANLFGPDCGHGYGFNPVISVILFLVQERVLSSRAEASNRSLALRHCVEILAQQLEDLSNFEIACEGQKRNQ
jgi:hypothetical protein